VKGEQIMYEIFEKLMQEKGVTMYRVSKDTGIAQATLIDWKKGRYVPKIDKLQKIADYFGVTVDYILGNEQKEKPLVNNDEELTEYLEELKTRPEMKMLFNLAKGATKEDVEKAVKIVEAFLKKD
jgi:transcriptional regulator with XRE-family HTH domain